MAQDVEVIVKQLYPIIEAKINTPAFIRKFKTLMSEFIERRHSSLYDIAPCDRIYFTQDDTDKMFSIVGLRERDISEVVKETYYGKIARFHPDAAKDPLTILALCILRYFFLTKKNNELDLALIYLSFSGKMYPSVHYGSYPTFQPSEYRHVMEYVVNNELTNKYDLKKHGNIINSIKSVGETWIDKYSDRLTDFDDEDIVYLVQQLRDRIKSFTKNIAEVYYKVYEDKDRYMTYDSDDLSDDNYRIADNDSLKVERDVEATMNNINSKGVDIRLVRLAANNNIRPEELRSILETIMDDRRNIGSVKELIRALLVDYYGLPKSDKDPTNIKFMSYSLAAKPNTKNPNVLRTKEILEEWLNENSPSYRKRKSRKATQLAYHKAVLTYFVLTINKSVK